jgi:hypothetical protein
MSREKVFTTGEIVNISQNDCNNFYGLADSLGKIIVLPMEILIGTTLLFILAGNAVWIAMTVMVIMTFVNYKIS